MLDPERVGIAGVHEEQGVDGRIACLILSVDGRVEIVQQLVAVVDCLAASVCDLWPTVELLHQSALHFMVAIEGIELVGLSVCGRW